MGIECWVVVNGLQTFLVTVDNCCGIACRSSLREGNTICFSCLFSHFIFMKILSIPIVALGVSHWRSTNVGLIQETIKVHVRTEKVNGKTIRKSERVCENSIRLITHVQSGLMMPSHKHTCMHGVCEKREGQRERNRLLRHFRHMIQLLALYILYTVLYHRDLWKYTSRLKHISIHWLSFPRDCSNKSLLGRSHTPTTPLHPSGKPQDARGKQN